MNIRDLAKARVVVVGDAMTDRWIYGHVDRISPEAPVQIHVLERFEDKWGGAGNVTENLQALGCRWWGVWPTEREGRPYPIKRRYIANNQQIFRADQEDCSPISEIMERRLMESLKVDADVLVISDYAKGVCTPSLCQQLIGWAKAKGVKVVVDPKGTDWSKYSGAYILTPNAKESSEVEGGNIWWQRLLVTRGSRGMTLFDDEQQIE